MKRFLTLAVGAILCAAVAAPAFSRANDRANDHLVWHGKVHMPKSMVPKRETVHEASKTYIPTAGRFVMQGKTQIWVPNKRLDETGDAREDKTAEKSSRGKFVQRGKAQFWVPDKE